MTKKPNNYSWGILNGFQKYQQVFSIRAKCCEWFYDTQWVRTGLKICRLRTEEVENLAMWGQFGHITMQYLKLFIIAAWLIYRTEHLAKVSRVSSYDWSF